MEEVWGGRESRKSRESRESRESTARILGRSFFTRSSGARCAMSNRPGPVGDSSGPLRPRQDQVEAKRGPCRAFLLQAHVPVGAAVGERPRAALALLRPPGAGPGLGSPAQVRRGPGGRKGRPEGLDLGRACGASAAGRAPALHAPGQPGQRLPLDAASPRLLQAQAHQQRRRAPQQRESNVSFTPAPTPPPAPL
jgi:hypothetical protein